MVGIESMGLGIDWESPEKSLINSLPLQVHLLYHSSVKGMIIHKSSHPLKICTGDGTQV